MDISIVIPAYNEENYISSTITSLKKWMPHNLKYEIIVVDHGSIDQTVDIANSRGAIVIDGKDAKTIAALRNLGTHYSTGEILFFIDADVTFSEEWSVNIGRVFASLQKDQNKICGSHPIVPENTNTLIKNWFNPKSTEKFPNYIGSCHLLISKKLFNKVNGFPEFMETAEEFTLCKNAKKQGATIHAHPELIVTHHGAPKTLVEFIQSEIWHGRGDWTSTLSILSSKASILSLLFIFFHCMLVYCFLDKNFNGALLAILAIFALCTTASFFKFFKHSFFYTTANIPTFYLYLLGRSMSLISFIKNKNFKKRCRII